MDRAEFEAGLTRDGFPDIGERELDAGKSVPKHTHPFAVRALVLDGEITLTTGEGAQTYRAGDVFVMEPGREHVETVGPRGVRYIVGRSAASAG